MVEVKALQVENIVIGPQRDPPNNPDERIEEGIICESRKENEQRVKDEGARVARCSVIKPA